MVWTMSNPGSRTTSPSVFEQQREELVREIAVVRHLMPRYYNTAFSLKQTGHGASPPEHQPTESESREHHHCKHHLYLPPPCWYTPCILIANRLAMNSALWRPCGLNLRSSWAVLMRDTGTRSRVKAMRKDEGRTRERTIAQLLKKKDDTSSFPCIFHFSSGLRITRSFSFQLYLIPFTFNGYTFA